MSTRGAHHSGLQDFCRLCLTEITTDNNSIQLYGTVSDMLQIVLPELNLSICESPSICNRCCETLKQSYSFKSSCLEAEDKIQEFVNPQSTILVDLKQVYVETRNYRRKISDDQDVCRTCLALGEKTVYTMLCSYEGDPLQNMFEKCLPEMSLNLSKYPRVCAMCLEQLEEQFHFIMQCLDTEAKINFYSEKKLVFKNISLSSVYLFTVCMEETEDIESRIREAGSFDNINCDKISAQRTDVIETGLQEQKNDTDFIDLTDDNLENIIKEQRDPYMLLLENVPNSKINGSVCKSVVNDIEPINISLHTEGQMQDSSDSEVSVTDASDLLEIRKVIKSRTPTLKRLNLEKSELDTKEKPSYKKEIDDVSEEEGTKKRLILRKCKICDFKTKFGSRMKAHMTISHRNAALQDDSEKVKQHKEKIFKCRQPGCYFNTKNPEEHKAHNRIHVKEKEQKCPHCSMVFVKSYFFNKHVESHTNSAQDAPKLRPEKTSAPVFNMNMNKLGSAVNKFTFNGHVLKMFKCRLCPYQTRLKSNYEKHASSHKKATEIVTHKCSVCNFETIQKENFLSHMQGHENDESNKILKCFLCSFQPKSKFDLKQHVNQIHKGGTG